MLSRHHDPGCTKHLLLQKWCPGETQAQSSVSALPSHQPSWEVTSSTVWLGNSSLLTLCCLGPMNDRGCLLLIPHEPEASDRDAQPQGDELFCNSGCLLMDFQKPLRAAEVWALRKQASLPGPVSTLCLSRRFSRGCLCHWGSAALCSGTSKCNRARFGGPASPLLVQECGCAALLLLPCSYAVWSTQQLSPWKIKTCGHIGAGWGATLKQHKTVWPHL